MRRVAPSAGDADLPYRRADVRRSLGGAVPRLAKAPQACDPAPVLVHEPGRQRDDAELLRVLAQAGRGGRRAEPVPRLHRRLQPVPGYPPPRLAPRPRRPLTPGRNSPSPAPRERRSEEHTSELQSLMRISYAVFCL